MALTFSPAIRATLYREKTLGGPLSPQDIILTGTQPTARNVVLSILSRGVKEADQILKVEIPAQGCVASKELTREDLCLAAHVLATSWEVNLKTSTQEGDKSAVLSPLLEKLYAGFPEVPCGGGMTVNLTRNSGLSLCVWFAQAKLNCSLPTMPGNDRDLVLAVLNTVPLEQIPNIRGIQIGDRSIHRHDLYCMAHRVRMNWQKSVGLHDQDAYIRFIADVGRAFPSTQWPASSSCPLV